MNLRNQRVMSKKLFQWCSTSEALQVVDVGSYDVNGTLKNVVPKSWRYIGVDRVPGPNVDRVMPSDYHIPVDSADVVISSSCFQYVRNPFKLMEEIRSVVEIDGVVIICAPKEQKEGLMGLPSELCFDGNPSFDCWRFLKGGMTALFEDTGFIVREVFYDMKCCWGVGVKI